MPRITIDNLSSYLLNGESETIPSCAKGVEKGLSLKKYTILFGKISAI